MQQKRSGFRYAELRAGEAMLNRFKRVTVCVLAVLMLAVAWWWGADVGLGDAVVVSQAPGHLSMAGEGGRSAWVATAKNVGVVAAQGGAGEKFAAEKWLSASGYDLMLAYVPLHWRGNRITGHPYANYEMHELQALAEAGDKTAQFFYAIDLGQIEPARAESMLLALYQQGNPAALGALLNLHDGVTQAIATRRESLRAQDEEGSSGQVGMSTDAGDSQHQNQEVGGAFYADRLPRDEAALTQAMREHDLRRSVLLQLAQESGDPVASSLPVSGLKEEPSQHGDLERRAQMLADYRAKLQHVLEQSRAANKGLSEVQKSAVRTLFLSPNP